MNLMTPDEARRLLDGTTPGPWFFDDDMAGRVLKVGPIAPYGYELECSTDDAALAAHAPDMAAMIAGMREEWGVSYRRVSYQRYHENEKRTTWGWETREDAERSMRLMTDVHVYGPVRRYVTETEEA